MLDRCAQALVTSYLRHSIRRSACEVLLEGSPPLYVPAGTSIILATLLMQRDQQSWGEDSEQFVPERWLQEEQVMDGGKDRRFVPFSAGPRTVRQYDVCVSREGPIAYSAGLLRSQCLGQSFALMQMSYFIVRLIQALTPNHATSSHCDAHVLTLKLDRNVVHKPPSSWLTGRGRLEQAYVASSVTMYIKGGLWINVDRVP